MTPHEHFKRGQELQADAMAEFRLASWSPKVHYVAWEDLDAAVAKGRVVMSLGARHCEHCAVLLPLLEDLADAEPGGEIAVFRHDLDSSYPQQGAALTKWPDPDGDPPQSETGLYQHRIPVTIYFEQGVEVRRHYGPDIDWRALAKRVK